MAIQTVRQRARLAPRREPYWHALGTGQHVGYRRTDDGGHWIARNYDAATRSRQYRALGDFAHLPDSERFTAAVKLAREFFEHVGKGGRRESLTVAQAWGRYEKHQREDKGEAAAADIKARYRRHVEGDPIAAITLDRLAPRHVEDWRKRLMKRPAMQAKRGPRCRVKTPQSAPRGKTPATLNRDMVPMRAALYLALRDGFVTSDHAWREKLKPARNAEGRRALYLTREQRRALLAAVEDDHLRAFLAVLAVLPLRPGALAAATVADLDARARVLTVRHDKAGAGRIIPLPVEVAASMRAAAAGKLPGAPLLGRWDGKPLDKGTWGPMIRRARERAELPSATVVYSLRHAAITDLVTSGLDLFTVAKLAGTSVAMIEKHYGHLRQEHARDALAGLAL